MLTILYQTVVAIIAFGLLIFVHELGHFLFAKLFRVGVLEFAVGFGKKIWQCRIGDTRYSIGIVPLGGYVRMVGDDPSVYREGQEVSPDDDTKPFTIEPVSGEDFDEVDRKLLEDKDRWFLEKSFWPKFLIVFAGPAFNVLFALFLSFVLFNMNGAPVSSDRPVIGSAKKTGPAYKAGLRAGDKVISIDGGAIESWRQIVEIVSQSNGEELAIEVEREGKTLQFAVTGEPMPHELALVLGLEDGRYLIGIQQDYDMKPVSFGESIGLAGQEVLATSVLTIKSVGWLISGEVSVKHVGGPIAIIKHTASSAKAGITALFNVLIFLSVSLAILNLLPIPVLDGGHIIFFIIEALMRKPLDLRVREIATQVGMVLILALMVFAIGNDLVNLVLPSESAF